MKLLLGLYLAVAAAAQETALHPIARFPIAASPLTITRSVESQSPFTVAGEGGAILGEQDGHFEAWRFPVKILSQFRISAELADYAVPIDVNRCAAAIEVAPAMTTITYSHAAFTVKQRMFAPRDPSAGVIVLFEIAAARPLRLTFQFKPEMMRMWPASNYGPANAEWVKQGESGYYVLHTNDPGVEAAVAMPRATPGILPPYQERPKTYPVEFKLKFDPKTDSGLFFPLLIAPNARRLAALDSRVAELYSQTENYYAHFFDTRLSVETPDAQFDRALQWAEIAIDKGRVRFHDETGLVAGYYESGDSARPGYAWFFGRDALWTSYAINSYGDFALTREALEFLIRRQRADGKIMHEFSQTADLVDWKATPYFYAAADSTPLFVMAMEDYVNTSDDVDFLRRHWDAVERAYAFTRSHDSDEDGIYENTEGTGWVESWPPGMPHQEIYLAALDQQSVDAMSRMAALMKDDALASAARQQTETIRRNLEAEYYEPAQSFYAFSRNADGSLDHTATIYPAVAWWTGRLALNRAGPMFSRWASDEFSTDWGTRDISLRTSFYDPISYHQGSVWPLFTGWVSMAEYRAGRPLSGYAHLMQNAGLTWSQDLGAVTELLSGEFFQPLGRSSSHQIWSSAMVVSPAVRGLFGLDWDALHDTLRLRPSLPAAWDFARLRNVPLGNTKLELEMRREGGKLVVRARSSKAEVVCLVDQDSRRDEPCHAQAALIHELVLPLPPAELGLQPALPLAGSQTGQLKVLDERLSPGRLEVVLEARGGSTWELPVRLNKPNVRVQGGTRSNGTVSVRFPTGEGYQRHSVIFVW
ncbi:MAG TPA: hypothetical protein VG675_00075 [Bryobacteraceae bacterium]|nr:hypothetical protein [Bryobacteraceae bacterium]